MMRFIGFAAVNIVVTVGVLVLGDLVTTSKEGIKAQDKKESKK